MKFIDSAVEAVRQHLGVSTISVESLMKLLVDFINTHISMKTPEALLFYYIDIIFSPKLILRHFAVIVSLQMVLSSSNFLNKMWRRILSVLTKRGMCVFMNV